MLVEHGAHHALLAQAGLYRQLWQKQTGFDVSDDGRQARIEPQRLRQMPLFAAVSLEELEAVADQFASEYYAANEMIFAQGDSGDRLYILVRGQVAVLATDAQGREQQIEILEDGDHFGEMALLHDKPRSATIKTLTPCVVISLSRHRFKSPGGAVPGHAAGHRLAHGPQRGESDVSATIFKRSAVIDACAHGAGRARSEVQRVWGHGDFAHVTSWQKQVSNDRPTGREQPAFFRRGPQSVDAASRFISQC